MLKGIPFELQNEIPWESATTTPQHNPLEKLPILLFADGRPPVYESAHIQTYIVEKYADRGPALLPVDIDDRLQAKQIVALCVGCLDAIVLWGWEVRREGERQSQKWIDRQNRKIDGAMRAFNGFVEATRDAQFVIGKEISIADIGIVCVVGSVEFLELRPGWRGQYPVLSSYFDHLDQMPVFQETRPVMFDIKEEVV